MAKALPCLTGLKELYVHVNNLGEAGAKAGAEALPHLTSLNSPDLRYNNIGKAGRVTVELAADMGQKLTVLYKEGQVGQGDDVTWGSIPFLTAALGLGGSRHERSPARPAPTSRPPTPEPCHE